MTSELPAGRVAIVDYGMGNLFSVKRACEQVGLSATITNSSKEVHQADATILPGVGAFGDAMAALTELGLVESLRETAASGKPLLGICLGMQLFMTASHEFGQHRGLGIVEGEVVQLEPSRDDGRKLKVPQVGWNRIHSVGQSVGQTEDRQGDPVASTSWTGTLLEGLSEGEFMYFVHSFYPKPSQTEVFLSTTRYGEVDFCSSFQQGSVFACQFHPERSGAAGLRIYRNLGNLIATSRLEHSSV